MAKPKTPAQRPYDNKGSRQRLVRVRNEVDDWLLGMSQKDKAKDARSRSGVATYINIFLEKAYEEAHPRRQA